MSVFSPDWLALREPADTNARSRRLTSLVSGALPSGVVHALDLGTGTGANVRYLAERLPGRQDWLLVDADPRLIAEARRRSSFGIARVVDLVAEVDSPDLGIFSGRDLVTASALLDLVSARWLRGLAGKCRQVGAAVLFSLTYDGEIRCTPEEPEDEVIRDLVNRHQQTDKGFGPALGPTASGAAERCFAGLGYRVESEPSPWVLAPETREDVAGRAIAELQRQLIDGWAEAASEMAPERLASIDSWRARRLAHVDANRSGLTVGHSDMAAWLP
ncbi:MAG: class I SAM-dependent methyltransferase [Acidobacteriota bacterium]